jgi:hypothetical protein
MASLTAAHRGYEYQDLLVACRLVDMLLGTVVQVHVDEKLTVDDRLTIYPPLMLTVPLSARNSSTPRMLIVPLASAHLQQRQEGFDWI